MSVQRLICLILLFLWTILNTHAQVNDDFSDGDFTVNPTWTGDDSEFEVDANQWLHLNAPAQQDTSHLSTASDVINDATWTFNVSLTFNPSGTNYADVYLVSDRADLKGDVNGYFVRIGNSSDEVSLYKSVNGTTTEIIDGGDGRLSTASVNTSVQVTRDAVGNWVLSSDTMGGTTFVQEGTAFDATTTSSSFFGIYCRYTISRSDAFYLDNVVITGNPFVDTFSPALQSSTISNSTEVVLCFDEPLDVSTETLSNFSLSGLGNATAATIASPDSLCVSLTFGSAMTSGTAYTLSYTAYDTLLNDSTDTIDLFYFDNIQPNAKDVVINEIFADPSPQVGLPAEEYLELYNASNTVFDLSAWEIVNSTTHKTIGGTYFYPGDYIILCNETDTALFNPLGTTVGVASFSALTNSTDSLTLLDDLGNIVDVVTYHSSWMNDDVKEDGGWSLELINPLTNCSDENNWSAATDATGGTPGTVNSIYDITPDTDAPSITNHVIVNNDIHVTFNEAVDSTSAVNTANYTIDQNTIASIVASGNTIIITLGAAIDTGITHNVVVSNVTDCEGNAIASEAFNFMLGYVPTAAEIVINEIYADYTPSNGLPAKEYIELYNTTNKYFDLSGVQFEGEDLSGILRPNEYLILCDDIDTALFSSYGSVLAVNSWPGLSNDGEQLTLSAGAIIDEVYFLKSWYQDDEKDEGGWSLERIDPTTTCNDYTNWSVSTHAQGGTPGEENSIYEIITDVTAPDVLSWSTTSNSITLNFSEPLDSSAFTISVTGSSFDSIVWETQLNGLIGYVATAFDTGVYYDGTVSIVDCPGNTASVDFQFVLGHPPVAGDLLINEIFPDPSPSEGLPDGEFVELWNASNKVIELNGVVFEGKVLTSYILQPQGYLILCEADEVVNYETYGNTLGLESWPSLTNSGEPLVLESPTLEIIDEINYQRSWYGDGDKDDGGWTIERINPFTPCNSTHNWLASNDADGGTPGQENSVHSTAPDDIFPSIVSLDVITANQLLVTFSEEVDTTALQLESNYTISPAVSVSFARLEATNDQVSLYAGANFETQTTYSLTIDNVADCEGNVITPSTINFVLPDTAAVGDLIINEILFDPLMEDDVDYIEIYNHSLKNIDLKDVQLANRNSDNEVTSLKSIATSQHIIYPGEYAVITTDSANVEAVYPAYVSGTAIELTSMPSYGNTDGEVLIVLPTGQVSDEFIYTDDMHFELLNNVEGISLERLSFDNPTQDAMNWHSASEDVGHGTPGGVNSQIADGSVNTEVEVIPTLFSPDNDGFDDYASINYDFGKAKMANIVVYDGSGRSIRRLGFNQLLAPSGTIVWDGITDENQLAPIGIYIIMFETFDVAGEVKAYKLTVTVTRKE